MPAVRCKIRTVNEILISSLVKTYPHQKDGRPALDGLRLSIPAGCLFGLVGPDGAGKTTLMRVLATVLLPSSGSAAIFGADVRQDPEAIRRIAGYMPQNFSLYPDLTVEENLRFFAEMQGVSPQDQEQRIPRLLDFARLQEFRARRSEHLSGGMRKKLALACALVHNPTLLLLDEPTTGVDPVSRRELWHLLTEVIGKGVTVVVSTPYMDEAERCHRVGMLYHGRLLAQAPPQELITAYPNQLVEMRTEPVGAARQALEQLPGLLSWRMVGDRLRLAVPDAARALSQLRSLLSSLQAETLLLRQARPSMEDVFIHLSAEGGGE